jgi:hypothetical protein
MQHSLSMMVFGGLVAIALMQPAQGQTGGASLAEIRKQAEAGNPEAQFRLGDLYGGYAGESELGFDDNEMAKWYELAAKNGHRDAQMSYASLFLYGRARPQDMTQATFWYQKAAAQGDDMGQYNVAIAYEMGDGAPKDLKLAYTWAALAAWTGNPDPSSQRLYERKRDELKPQLSAAELATAEAKIKEYQAKLPRRQ